MPSGEKEHRSGSQRTVLAYSCMLNDFFRRPGKPPDAVTSQDVFAYAHGVGLSGRTPSAVTVGARTACISSFYRFLIRMGVVAANPSDALDRPKVATAPPRGLNAGQVRRLLAIIPETPAGLRDRAIILTLVLTGRRWSEVVNLKAGDLSFDADRVYYTYRGKGGKRGRRELPRPAYDALLRALEACGKDLVSMAAEESLWPVSGGGSSITDGTAYLRFRQYLKPRGCRRPDSTSSAHGREAQAGRRGVGRGGERSSTTARSPSPRRTCDGSRARTIEAGPRSPTRSA